MTTLRTGAALATAALLLAVPAHANPNRTPEAGCYDITAKPASTSAFTTVHAPGAPYSYVDGDPLTDKTYTGTDQGAALPAGGLVTTVLQLAGTCTDASYGLTIRASTPNARGTFELIETYTQRVTPTSYEYQDASGKTLVGYRVQLQTLVNDLPATSGECVQVMLSTVDSAGSTVDVTESLDNCKDGSGGTAYSG